LYGFAVEPPQFPLPLSGISAAMLLYGVVTYNVPSIHERRALEESGRCLYCSSGVPSASIATPRPNRWMFAASMSVSVEVFRAPAGSPP